MNDSNLSKPKSIIITAIIALIFGVVTIYSGGDVIFINGAGRAAAGEYISFIVWFNFLAGFAYIIAAIGLYNLKVWAVKLSLYIAIVTLLFFGFMGLHILFGGAYEIRTLAAMVLRSGVWIAIAYFAHLKLKSKVKL